MYMISSHRHSSSRHALGCNNEVQKDLHDNKVRRDSLINVGIKKLFRDKA